MCFSLLLISILSVKSVCEEKVSTHSLYLLRVDCQAFILFQFFLIFLVFFSFIKTKQRKILVVLSLQVSEEISRFVFVLILLLCLCRSCEPGLIQHTCFNLISFVVYTLVMILTYFIPLFFKIMHIHALLHKIQLCTQRWTMDYVVGSVYFKTVVVLIKILTHFYFLILKHPTLLK